MLERLVLVGTGAFVGAILRYWLGLLVVERLGAAFPYGTLLINIAGSLVLGFVVVTTLDQTAISPSLYLVLGPGLCGGFTTFSTFAVEVLTLIEERAYLPATTYVAASVILSLLAALVGGWLARLI